LKVTICQCHHTPAYLIEEIGNGRPVQKFVEDESGVYVLICLICGKLWNHEDTDWLIETVLAPERAPIREPWEE
jgi:hypothetical protein